MRPSTEIKEEIDKTRLRQSQLNTEKLQAEADVKVNEAKFVDGSATVEDLNAGRSKLNLINDSIRSFSQRMADLLAELGIAEASEAGTQLTYDQIRKEVAAAEQPLPDIDARFGKRPTQSPWSNFENLRNAQRARGGAE